MAAARLEEMVVIIAREAVGEREHYQVPEATALVVVVGLVVDTQMLAQVIMGELAQPVQT
jgi:hypothetical protein